MAQFTPPPSTQVDFNLGPASPFLASSVPFELGVIQKSVSDSGALLDLRVGLTRYSPKQEWGTAVEAAIFPSKRLVRQQTGTGTDARVALEGTIPVRQTGSGVDTSQLTGSLEVEDPSGQAQESATIPQATQVTGDSGTGASSVVWYAFSYIEVPASDAGAGTEGTSSLEGTLSDSDHGRGEEGEATESVELEPVDEAAARDKAKHVFVAQFGRAWGMTPVQLPPIQEE